MRLLISLVFLINLANCKTLHFFTNEHLYETTERNDERTIVEFKDFYSDVVISKKDDKSIKLRFRFVNDYKSLVDTNSTSLNNDIKTDKNKDLNPINTFKDLSEFLEKNNQFEIVSMKQSPLICIEPVGPAYTMNNLKLSIENKDTINIPNVGGTEKLQKVNLDYYQSLAKIYNVSDIMQYGHASLHNLCIMYGNRVINSKDYKDILSTINNNISNMIVAQSK